MERNYPEIIISDEGVTWLDKGQMLILLQIKEDI